MILIISDKLDVQVPWVTYYLRQWGVPYIQFNVAEYPLQVKHTSIWNAAGISQFLHLPEGKCIDCSTVTAVWYRKPEYPKLSKQLAEFEKEYAYAECQKDLDGLYKHLQDCYWINPVHNLRLAENKPWQLSLAPKLGFSIPDTLITNDPDEAWRFYEQYQGNIVYKTLSTGRFVSRKGPGDFEKAHGFVFTSPLQSLRRADFDGVANCPCLFQQYVKKQYELRVTVVRQKVFAVEIHSQENPVTVHDWRHGDADSVSYNVHTLPDELIGKCISLVNQMGLQFGAIDMIYTPEKKYVFLEINPNGQYGWIEQATGLEISAEIAKALVEGAKERGH